MATGMLSNLFGVPPVDPERAAEEERAMALGRMNPFQAAAQTSYAGAAQAGRGLGSVAAGLTGRDTRTPTAKRTDAIEAAKAQVAQLGFDPEDPKSVDDFYRRVVQILQKQGLAGEALEVAREWRTQSTAEKRAATQQAESERKSAADLARDARTKERNEILRQNGVPEFGRYIEMIEKATDPATRQMYTERVNQMLGKSGKGIKVVDLGDAVQLVDAATGAPIGAEMAKGAVPMNEKDAAKAGEKEKGAAAAYANAMAKAQADYDAAARLYNHPGVEGITGRLGRLVGTPGAAGQSATTLASADSRSALNLWEQVVGATFLAGLNDLKAASPVGSTGLGQVSNIEGDKVQSSKAALKREQDAADFRTNLKIYLDSLVSAAARLSEGAQRDGIAPIPLKVMPLTGGGTPRAARAPAEDTVKVKLPDGREGVIPRANLEAAKAAGAVEVK